MYKSVREWTLTLLNELPLWELESQWIAKSSESTCKCRNSLDWKVPYIIKNLLERRCLKWVRMTHLDTSNTSYGQKKGRVTIWLPTTKIQESPQFHCVQLVCDIPLESSQQRLYICFRPHLNRRFAHKIMGPQSHMSPNFGNCRTPVRESRDKMTFGC
jgi:hypothetical protein